MKNTIWCKWSDRKNIVGKNQPAVYFIAYSENDISDNDFTMLKEIIYIGVSISKQGLIGRLNQFKRAMNGAIKTHSAAERVREKHLNIDDFFKYAFVSARIFDISKAKSEVEILRIKGKCLGDEYASFADYMEKYHLLPEFNNKSKKSKK
jgi:hypothetical protein